MYTLILSFALATGFSDGGVALSSQKMELIPTLELCRAAGEQAVKELTPTNHLVRNNQHQTATRTEVRYSCLKVDNGK